MVMIKRCYKCKEVKEKSEFGSNRSKPDGLHNACKVCDSLRKKRHYVKNREAILNRRKEYQVKNCDKIRERKKKYRVENREIIRNRDKEHYKNNREVKLKRQKEYVQNNRDKVNTWVANRRARKLNACPDWLTQEHHNVIADLYATAQKLTKETGIPHHVDHIVPLKGKSYDLGTKRMRHTISGLHVPWNLQVVSEEENLSKGCRYSEWK